MPKNLQLLRPRQTGGYDIRSFKVHLTPAQAIPDLKVGMRCCLKSKRANNAKRATAGTELFTQT